MILPALEQALAEMARTGRTTTYGALAAQLGQGGPLRIRQVTDALEQTMRADAAAGRPLRAALVLGRANAGLPARGFFDMAQALGLCGSDIDGPHARAFHIAQLTALREMAAGGGID